ncbi:MAG: DUF4908 domain-containing protein [Oceanicaulis sp.]
MFRGLLALFLLAAGVWAGLAGTGFAQLIGFSGSSAASGAQPVESAWYERADNRGRLILDQSSRTLLLWEEGSPEVYALRWARAAGGGEIWFADTDRAVLRMSNLGGYTYFPEDRPQGVIVDPIGPARPLVAAPADAEALQSAAQSMVERLADLSRNEVSAQLTALPEDQNPYIIDAMLMIEIGADSAQRRSLRDLEIVRVGVGEVPRASFDGRTLDVSVATARGYAGRPSSAYIRRVLED